MQKPIILIYYPNGAHEAYYSDHVTLIDKRKPAPDKDQLLRLSLPVLTSDDEIATRCVTDLPMIVFGKLDKPYIPGTVEVQSLLTDSIGDTLAFYIVPAKATAKYDYVITDDGYSLDSPVLYGDHKKLKRILEAHDPMIHVDKDDNIKEYATAETLKGRLMDYLQELVFAQGADYVLINRK